MLLGEYAVLDGAGAIVAAVDHGVECAWTPGTLGWSVPGDDRFVRAVLAEMPLDLGQFEFRDWRGVDLGGAKPGFGGSAAATVAAVLASEHGRAAKDGQAATRAFDIHHGVQGGGSGVDIFASLNGCLRRFPDGVAVAPPPFAVVWSGKSAQTGPRVKQYTAWGRSSPEERRSFVLDSRALVDAFERDPVGSTRAAWRRLRAMAREAGLDYDTPEHTALAEAAERFGGAGKPSGAGGGDIAVAVFNEPETRDAYAAYCSAKGFTVIPCALAEPAGLRALRGPRVDLMPFTPERLDLALHDRAGLARSLEATIPASWPQPDYAAVMGVLADRWRADKGEASWAWLVVKRGAPGAQGELIGEIGGKGAPGPEGTLELGYAIVPERRRQGYATEAGDLYCRWARSTGQVKLLTAECLESNAASRCVLAALGLTPCGSRAGPCGRVLMLRG